jgi:hypothetical protein
MVLSSAAATLQLQDVPGLGRVQVVGKDGPVNGGVSVHKQVFMFVNILTQL